VKRLAKTHDLLELLNILERNLAATKRGPVPNQWKAIIKKFAQLEDEAADRFRYEKVRWRRSRISKSGKARRPERFKQSFPREKPIPARHLIESTERLIEEALDPNQDRATTSMYLDWYYESQSYAQDLYAKGLLE
jgi:hypothetical protein